MIRDISFTFHIPTASLLKLFSILPRTICNHFSHTPDNLLKPFPTPCENYFLLYIVVGDEIFIYYGAADLYCCLATVKLQETLNYINQYRTNGKKS